jgi:general nucleoside transport system permease protein
MLAPALRSARLVTIEAGAVCVGTLVAVAVLAAVGGPAPQASLASLWNGAFGSGFALAQSVLKAIPLALTGLAVALPLRLRLWNIGAEGQLYAGAIGASWIALSFDNLAAGAMVPALVAVSVIAGAAWALLAAVPRALWGVDEIISTLMLNYVAILGADYLVTGPWRSSSALNFPISDDFPASARLPALGLSGLHLGVVLPVVAGILLILLLRWSKWGFELRMTAANPSAAAVVGIPIRRNILVCMAIGGALSGVAGMIEVVMSFGALQQGISPGYGYIGIVVATLAATTIVGTLVLAFLMGGLVVGGLALQTLGVSDGFVLFLQGVILFSALLGSRMAGVRLLRRRSVGRLEPGTTVEAT